MTLEEERIWNRQNELLKNRRAMIEAGQLTTCQPLPGEERPKVYTTASDECPSCGARMSWYPARQAFLCVQEGCQ